MVVNQVVWFDCRMSASEVTTEATHANLRDTQSVLQVEAVAYLELNRVDYAVERKKSLRARYYFGIIFLIMNFIAWFFRDYGQGVLPFIHRKSIFCLSISIFQSHAIRNFVWHTVLSQIFTAETSVITI